MRRVAVIDEAPRPSESSPEAIEALKRRVPCFFVAQRAVRDARRVVARADDDRVRTDPDRDDVTTSAALLLMGAS